MLQYLSPSGLSSSQGPFILSSLTVHRKLLSLMGHTLPPWFSLLHSPIVGVWRPVLGSNAEALSRTVGCITMKFVILSLFTQLCLLGEK